MNRRKLLKVVGAGVLVPATDEKRPTEFKVPVVGSPEYQHLLRESREYNHQSVKTYLQLRLGIPKRILQASSSSYSSARENAKHFAV